ncbi:ABC transporter substrate-binding protein [Aureivirga marina]|uniref:ABC transporter substrate-binding protein n=1 Tax=Aureivirga marina TaxID=1182451 RepID=UPI0018CA0E01|nr:ABC transporter substrate-binding protein [Aureivirga marina]
MKKIKNKIFTKTMLFSFLILSFFTTISSCSSDDDSNQTVEKKKVRLFIPNPEKDNLQLLNFWIAQGAGFFEEENLELEITTGSPKNPQAMNGSDILIQTTPHFLASVAKNESIVGFAKLFQNDAANIILKNSIATERNLSLEMPLKDRLLGLEGLKIGVAKGPDPRLELLFSSQGLDLNSIATKVIVEGHDQNDAFENGEIDAIFVHTPYLENAIINQNAILLVDISGGEVPALANMNLHILAATNVFSEENPEILKAFSQAICSAQTLIHSDRNGTIQALKDSEFSAFNENTIHTILDIYEEAIPSNPSLFLDWERELNLFPTGPNLPEITVGDLISHSNNSFTEELNCE